MFNIQKREKNFQRLLSAKKQQQKNIFELQIIKYYQPQDQSIFAGLQSFHLKSFVRFPKKTKQNKIGKL